MTRILLPDSRDEPVSDSIGIAASRIADSIRNLQERWDRLGTKDAFNPQDAETNAAFAELWAHSFSLQYPAKVQDRILDAMERNHPGSVEAMRDIGHASEIEMEKGHARLAIRRAQAIPLDPQEGMRIFKTGLKLKSMKAEVDEEYRKAKQLDDEDRMRVVGMERNRVHHLISDSINDHADAYNALTAAFPYKTYQAMSHAENLMLTGIRGLEPNTQFPGTHLIIEAGALPETAIFSSISRMGGSVIGVISDRKSFDLAQQLIGELEQRHILVPGAVRLIHADPLSPEFKTLRFTDSSGNTVKPYAATITQLVKGKNNVEKIASALIEDHGIDTLVVRGAHQFTRLLYEPLDDLHLPGQAKCRLTAVPKHAQLSQRDSAGGEHVLQHARKCYNSSHVYSTRHKHPAFSLNDPTMFVFEGAGTSR